MHTQATLRVRTHALDLQATNNVFVPKQLRPIMSKEIHRIGSWQEASKSIDHQDCGDHFKSIRFGRLPHRLSLGGRSAWAP